MVGETSATAGTGAVEFANGASPLPLLRRLGVFACEDWCFSGFRP